MFINLEVLLFIVSYNKKVSCYRYIFIVSHEEEPGEQYNVVFALIVTEQDVCGYVTNYAKTTVHCSPDMHK